MKIFQLLLVILFCSFVSFQSLALPPECKEPNAPPKCFNKSVSVNVNEIDEAADAAQTDTFSEVDWIKAETIGELLSGDDAGINKSCGHLCSKSKQFCNPADLSPCHGTGGTCKQYCW